MSEEIMADIQRSLGRIENKVDTALTQLGPLRAEVDAVKLAQAGQRGSARVWTMLWNAVSAAFGAITAAVLAHHGR